MPFEESFAQRPLCHTWSNAPLMSSATTYTSPPLSRVLFHVWDKTVRRSAVLWFGLNPYCLLEIRSWRRRYFCSCLWTEDSITLLMTESRDMGRYFDGSDLESLLWIGITLAVFHWSGNKPWEKNSWKRRLRGLASSAAHSLRTLVGISSGPVAFPGSRLRSMFLTSLGLKWTSAK